MHGQDVEMDVSPSRVVGVAKVDTSFRCKRRACIDLPIFRLGLADKVAVYLVGEDF